MIFDLLVVALVVLSVAWGAFKGFAWQLAGIISLVAGFGVALPLSRVLGPLFGNNAPLNRFVAGAVIYVVVSLAVYVAALWYRKVIERVKLEHWDRHLGGVAGAVKGFLLSLALVYFSVTLFQGLRDPVLSTRSGRAMAYVMYATHPIWPPEVHAIIHPYIHHLEEPKETGETPKDPPPGR